MKYEGKINCCGCDKEIKLQLETYDENEINFKSQNDDGNKVLSIAWVADGSIKKKIVCKECCRENEVVLKAIFK